MKLSWPTTGSLGQQQLDTMLIISLDFSYHQKYVLQCHEGLVKQLGLNSKLLQTSHVAAKLNSYLAGVGGEKQFLEEAQHLGLNKKQTDYVLQYLRKNENIFSC